MGDFYVTLFSTSSEAYYPNNMTNSFTNHLSRPIHLSSDYLVSLSEISLPSTSCMNNITYGNNKVFISTEVDFKLSEFEGPKTIKTQFVIELDIGVVKNIEDLVNIINKHFIQKSRCEKLFEIEKSSGKVLINQKIIEGFDETSGEPTVVCREADGSEPVYQNFVLEFTKLKWIKDFEKTSKLSNLRLKIYLQNRLAMMLGYNPKLELIGQIPNIPRLDFGYPDEILVYTDLIKPQLIGHSFTQVLKSIPIEHHHHSEIKSINRSFNNECFMKLAKHQFQTINIELRDRAGNLIPFHSGYNVTLLLHFKKMSSLKYGGKKKSEI